MWVMCGLLERETKQSVQIRCSIFGVCSLNSPAESGDAVQLRGYDGSGTVCAGGRERLSKAKPFCLPVISSTTGV